MKSNKIYLVGSLITGLLFLFFLTTKLFLGDDSIVRNTWNTSYFGDKFYRAELTELVADSTQNEIFFAIEQTKTTDNTSLKLVVDLINKDDEIIPVNEFSHVTQESLEVDKTIQTAYSFSIPIEDWRYIRFTFQSEKDGVLSNQSIMYADYRMIENSEEPIILSEFLADVVLQQEENEVPQPNQPTDEVEPTPPTESTETESETPTTESEPTEEDEETLQQDYEIEREPIILDGGDQNHVEEGEHTLEESETPIYTLDDLKHQAQKLTDEIATTQSALESQADNEELKTKLTTQQQALQNLQTQIQQMESETSVNSES